MQMPTLRIPNDASIHTIRRFLSINSPFADGTPPAVLQLHRTWAHMDPMALAMSAAWGGWCQRNGLKIQAINLGKHANYAARMHLFKHLSVGYNPPLTEHEEAGRFMPLIQVKTQADLDKVISDVSALLHLDNEPDGLAAVQYCVSELIRNVIEHSSSPEGAYVCAQRYISSKENNSPKRVTIAVADCGVGIAKHIGRAYPEALDDGPRALSLAMRPGITGARKDGYGSSDNAGAGLFITRAIAKATGGYFVLLSGNAAFRLMRTKNLENLQVFLDAFNEPRHNILSPNPWQGVVASVEIGTDQIGDFDDFFKWVRTQLPAKRTVKGKIKFT